MEKIELLAPAGDLKRLKVAFLYGADAVYIGGSEYSLRANANNFTISEIKEATSFAHNLGKKVYVTVNIIFHNENLDGIDEYLSSLNDAHVDGVIVADLFIVPIVKSKYPNMEVHISTQSSITNYESVKFLLKNGVDRVVLAREVSAYEIKEIYDKTKASLEVFLHGAMCTNYSGRCVLSNYFTNRDANRGGCAQVCRFNFDLDHKRDTEFALATKDLNLAEYIPDLIKLNVRSLKIEGRMRSSYYIATVISCYRILIDAYYNNNFTQELLDKNLKILSRVANRESTAQYFKGEVSTFDQYYIGRCEVSNQDFLGVVLAYDKDNHIVTLEQRNYFKVGDKISFFGPNGFNFDYEINEIYDNDMNLVDCARHPREIIKLKINKELPIGSFMRVGF